MSQKIKNEPFKGKDRIHPYSGRRPMSQTSSTLPYNFKSPTRSTDQSQVGTTYKTIQVANQQNSLTLAEVLPSLPVLATEEDNKNDGKVSGRVYTRIERVYTASMKTNSAAYKENKALPGISIDTNVLSDIDIACRKVRERLIHMLAIQPLQKSVIYTRLHGEGLRNCERPVIPNILKDIAECKANTYTLRNHSWKLVDLNWPFYSKEERQQVQLQIEQLKQHNKE
ncbi:unnamed protein product [Ceratitis capitata]|uniref:(Mediterranean fruit fly) hypothetical protein n=1 Tax=Ceratitis capitata TaxID=7213 RepID=A0A811TZ86_CERCA|nr:unnamed protein product [Ceratitis capitata]